MVVSLVEEAVSLIVASIASVAAVVELSKLNDLFLDNFLCYLQATGML